MVVLVLGALGQAGTPVLLLQLLGIGFLVFLAFKKGRPVAPWGFFLYLAFIAIAIWKYLQNPVKTDLDYLYLFAGGGALWFAAFNLGEDIRKPLGKLIILLGLLLGVLYLFVLVRGSETIVPGSLYAPASAFKNHNHIGDLWALVLLVGLDRLLVKRSAYLWGLVGLGFIFLFVSSSRSGLVAFVVGATYLFSEVGIKGKYRLLFVSLILAVTAIFFLTSAGKTVFFSRPYFNQAVRGILSHPAGVGLGNFKAISSAFFELGAYSTIVHNIILEVLVGVGWLGLVFAGWLGLSLGKILTDKGPERLYKAIFLAITVNFMFDSTYAIATMIWLWFLSLGLSHARHSRG